MGVDPFHTAKALGQHRLDGTFGPFTPPRQRERVLADIYFVLMGFGVSTLSPPLPP